MASSRRSRLAGAALAAFCLASPAAAQDEFPNGARFAFTSSPLPGASQLLLFDELNAGGIIGDLPIGGLASDMTAALGAFNNSGPIDVAVGVGLAGGGSLVGLFDGGSLDFNQTPAGLLTLPFDPISASGVNVAAGDVTGDGIDDVITGAGPDGTSQVKVFDGATGAELRSFFAFDTAFQGGVSVATADITGDGVPDIITGTGAGAGGQVKVFDGANFSELTAVSAVGDDFSAGLFVAGGDLDGDGVGDVVVGANQGGAPQVQVFSGAGLNNGSATPIASFFAYEQGFPGGVRVAVGDATGDGKNDIITAPGPGREPDVNFFAFNPGVFVSLLDAPSAGGIEIALGTAADPTFELAGTFTPFPASFTAGVHLAAIPTTVPEPTAIALAWTAALCLTAPRRRS